MTTLAQTTNRVLTIEQAKALRHGQILHHWKQKNADGTPLRVCVNGKVQTWKTRPDECRIPVKRGLYSYGAITHRELEYWTLA